MKKIYSAVLGLGAILLLSQCDQDDFLNVSSPDKTDDAFVTSTVTETLKCIEYGYNRLRSNAGGGNYNWNDSQSDAEYYPEFNSNNGRIGYLHPEESGVDNGSGLFNTFYEVLARASRVAGIIAQKEEYTSAKAAGQKNDWTQLYGECVTMYSWCYFELTRHQGDVPFGIENSIVNSYTLTDRWTIWAKLDSMLIDVEPLMYDLGEGGLTAERMSRSFAVAMIGEINLYAGSYQTIREDYPGLYDGISFEKMYTDSKYSYARRTDYQQYIQKAQTWLRRAINERNGAAKLVTTDERTVCNNPFQRNFQYIMDMEVSPESYFETGNMAPLQSERPYSQGRGSNGATSQAAPCKVFGGIRVMPTYYYEAFEDGDKRWDASAVVTGSDGAGNEAMVTLASGSKLAGGICINKWDISKMSSPYVIKCRNSGMNYQLRRYTNYLLMLAEADIILGDNAEALSLLNQLRDRAFGDTNHRLQSVDLRTLVAEVGRETLGEGDIRWTEIRTGLFTQYAKAMRTELKSVIAGLEANGYYTFPNGRTISNYIWVKYVKVPGCLVYDRDDSDPALTPGWRGIYDYSTIELVASKVKGTDHNLAIQGLFRYIDPAGAEAAALEADGYTKTVWGIDMVNQKDQLWDYNMLSGIERTDVPLYFHSIPKESLLQSGKSESSASPNGYNVWNGYDIPNE